MAEQKIKNVKISFEQWCKENNHQDYLDLWDYELNDKKPSEISYSSTYYGYFKCRENIHESSKWKIERLVNKNITCNVSCRFCKSFGMYLLKEYGESAVAEYWSNTNKENPMEVRVSSHKKVVLICRNCGKNKLISPANFIKQGLSCGCGDGNSYPNKFVTELLNQLGVGFETERRFPWLKSKRYDHYINNINAIIENHGGHHYWENNRGATLKEEQNNDRLKKESALSNGIEYYIELDCRKSESEYIKNSIMNSELPNLLNFKEEDIDWTECEKFATKNLVKEVCDLWNTGEYATIRELGVAMHLNKVTIWKYLKIGEKLMWTVYDADLERDKNNKNKDRNKNFCKEIIVFKDGTQIGVFESAAELARISNDVLGVSMSQSNISATCLGRYKTYKGFAIKFSNNKSIQQTHKE